MHSEHDCRLQCCNNDDLDEYTVASSTVLLICSSGAGTVLFETVPGIYLDIMLSF